MESVIFRTFDLFFKSIGVLAGAGLILAALADMQKHAFESKKRGLVSMSRVNQKLVGKTE